MSDDPFRDWLAETKEYADDNWDPTLIDVLDDVIAAYDRIAAPTKPVLAMKTTDDAGTANQVEAPSTGDPRNDQEAYDAAMEAYRAEIKRVLVNELTPHLGDINHVWLTGVARAIAALPKPTNGGER